jgi:hypothetical protein
MLWYEDSQHICDIDRYSYIRHNYDNMAPFMSLDLKWDRDVSAKKGNKRQSKVMNNNHSDPCST